MIENFCTAAEIEALRELAQDRIVLELGSYKGYTAIEMAKAGARCVHAVDWHQGDEHLGFKDTLCEMWHNLEEHGVRDKVVLHVGRFQDMLGIFERYSFGLAFVDGCHETQAVIRDLDMTLPLVHHGGVVALHDYGRWGVKEAVQDVVKRWHLDQPCQLIDSLAVLCIP